MPEVCHARPSHLSPGSDDVSHRDGKKLNKSCRRLCRYSVCVLLGRRVLPVRTHVSPCSQTRSSHDHHLDRLVLSMTKPACPDDDHLQSLAACGYVWKLRVVTLARRLHARSLSRATLAPFARNKSCRRLCRYSVCVLLGRRVLPVRTHVSPCSQTRSSHDHHLDRLVLSMTKPACPDDDHLQSLAACGYVWKLRVVMLTRRLHATSHLSPGSDDVSHRDGKKLNKSCRRLCRYSVCVLLGRRVLPVRTHVSPCSQTRSRMIIIWIGSSCQ